MMHSSNAESQGKADADQQQSSIFRVRSANVGANTRAATWVRAESAANAENFVRDLLERHRVKSVSELTPPAEASIHDITGETTR